MNDNKIEKTQLRWTIALTVVGVLILAALVTSVIFIVPAASSVREAAESAAASIGTLEELSDVDLASVAKDLESVAAELSEIDWKKLAEDIDKTATDAQTGMESAMVAIESIDIETLNDAIDDLHTIIKPLADFFGVFKK